MRIGILFALTLGAASPLWAQAGAPPDPATIALPDMTPTRDPGVIRDGWKHFYFHKAGVGYAEAYADFAECYRFLPVAGMSPALPAFSPWTEPLVLRPIPPSTGQFGLVGVAIGAMVAGPLERRAHQARMRRCLEPRGYVRYPLREEVWAALIDDYSRQSIALQALAASGPAPGLEPVAR
jgi:hypothetical protein